MPAVPPALPRPTSLHRLEYALLIAVTAVLRLMGVDRASAFMGYVWRHLAPFNARHARALKHLRRALPGKTEADYEKIIGDMWENLGRIAAETILLPEVLADPSRITTTIDEAQVAEAVNRGAILVSFHGGNWELISVPLAERGFRLNAIYKAMRNPLSDAYLLKRRRHVFKGQLLPRDQGIALKLRNLVRSGNAIALLADLWDPNAMTLDFFGHPASAALFPAVLARRLKAPLFIARAVRTKGVHFHVDGYFMEIPLTNDADADARTITAMIHKQFEEWITEHPAQWMWAQRKWHETL